MIKVLIRIQYSLLLINVCSMIMALLGKFENRDIVPIITGATFLLLTLISHLVRPLESIVHRIFLSVVIVISGFLAIHFHFNVYMTELESTARQNALEIIGDRRAPPLTHFLALNGNNFMEEKFYGNYEFTIINFWGTWCPPCLIEMPVLNEFYSENRKNGVNIIGYTYFLSKRDTLKLKHEIHKIEKVVRELNISYPVLIDSTNTVLNSYRVVTFPTTVLLNNNGDVIDYQVGLEGAGNILRRVKMRLN